MEEQYRPKQISLTQHSKCILECRKNSKRFKLSGRIKEDGKGFVYHSALKATDTHVEESAIERVLHEVFPKHEEDLVAKARDDANADARPVRRRRKEGKATILRIPGRMISLYTHSAVCGDYFIM